ncbi:MAG: NAD kinase [Muribaculaceae bacterium]|nr:NAD kinase [Muribaculaceae bacterium]
MEEIVIFGNNYQGAHADTLSRFFSGLLAMKGLRVRFDKCYRDYLAGIIPEAVAGADTFDCNDFTADLALSIGGDGTFLHTANRIGDKQIPIMGLNSGHLGYLSAAPLSDVDNTLELIAAKNYIIEPRTMLAASCDTHKIQSRPFALNEAAILRQDTGSMITVDTFVDGYPISTYLGDGLIIATPTGSTAYNLSAGGPILAPSARNWVITPIAPHSLNMRPLVVSDSSVIEVVPRSRSNSFALSLDGNTRNIPVGTRIRLGKASFVTNVVRLPHHTFADTLRNKLLWGVNIR